jgi:hypothetical protein
MSEPEPEAWYGWYSWEASLSTSTSLWEREDGREVEVVCVTKEPNNPGCDWPNLRCVGRVTRYLRAGNVTIEDLQKHPWMVAAVMRGFTCNHKKMKECHPGCGHYYCPDCGLAWDDYSGH